MTPRTKGRGMRQATGRPLAAAVALAALLTPGPAGGPTPLAAQQSGAAGDTLVLTLDDALRIAEANNPAYRQAVNETGLIGVETRATWANQVLPQASLNLFNTNYTGNVQRIARDNFGNPIANPSAEWVYFSGTTQSLGLQWNVQGSSIATALRGREVANEGRRLAEDVALATLVLDVRRRYFDLLEQRELLAVEQAIAEARQADLGLARGEFRLARRSRVDVLNAELQVEQQALAVRQQDNAYLQARLGLRTQLGDDRLGPFRLADEPLPLFDPAGLDEDALVARAVEAHPDVRQAQSAVATERIGVREAKNEWWPDLFASYNIYRRAQTTEGDALFDLSFDEDLDQSFGIQLSFPFFTNYFGNKQAIEQAEVALDNAQESLREARLGIEEQVRTALLGLRSQHEALRLAVRSQEIAAEALALSREEYRLGTRTFEQLQQAIENEADARRNVITARFAFVEALLTLEDAVGAPVRGAPPATDGVQPSGAPAGDARSDASTVPAARPGG